MLVAAIATSFLIGDTVLPMAVGRGCRLVVCRVVCGLAYFGTHALALPGLETWVIFGIKLRAASYMFKICWRGWRPRLPPSLAGVWIYLKAAWHEATGHFYCGTWGNMRAPLASTGAVSLLAHVHVRAARRHIKAGKAQE